MKSLSVSGVRVVVVVFVVVFVVVVVGVRERHVRLEGRTPTDLPWT
jgi:hypothetical protein